MGWSQGAPRGQFRWSLEVFGERAKEIVFFGDVLVVFFFGCFSRFFLMF